MEFPAKFTTVLLLAAGVAIYLLVRYRGKAARQPAQEILPPAPAGDASDGKNIDLIYALTEKVARFFNATARPGDLRGRNDFQEAVAFFRNSAFTPDDLVGYFRGDNAVISCFAAEALRQRGDGAEIRDRLTAHLGTVAPWPLYFALEFLAAAAPAEEPLIGPVLGRTIEHWAWPQSRVFLEAFIRDRLAAGEAPRLGDEMSDLTMQETESLAEFLEQLEPDTGAPMLEAFRHWDDSRIDRKFLASIGTVWGDRQAEQAATIIEHEVLKANAGEFMAILQAKRPSSVLLVGAAGVGKTALVQYAARRLYDQGWVIFEAGHTDLMAGQTFIGQLEDRVRQLVGHLRGNRRILWVIPGFHMLAYTGRHMTSPVNVLDMILPYVEAGEIVILGEIQPAAHGRLLEHNPRIATALSTAQVPALSGATTRELGMSWMARWAKDDGNRATVIGECWELAQQFLGETAAPGNLLKLLDLTRQRLTGAHTTGPIDFELDDVITTLSQLTGLPNNLLDQRRALDLESLRRFFNQRVMGQTEAVDCLVERVAMIKAGVTDPTRPSGVFLFAGPSGTGKTEIAKTLAEWLFGSQNRMLRIDMSELQTPKDLDRILGSENPEDRGALVDRIRRQPFSVVRLDEFEKAAAPAWDVFLQMFDDGRLTDRRGYTADFRHSIIILTSNLGGVIPTGASMGFRTGNQGFDPDLVSQTISKTFRREFVNRLDRVIVFQPLSRELMRQILEKELDAVFRRRGLRTRSWAVEWDQAAIDFLLEKGFTVDLGARPLRRAVERYLLSPLAMTIVNRQAPAGDQFLFVTRKSGGLEVQFVDPDTAAAGEADAGAEPEAGAAPPAGGDSLRAIALKARGTGPELAALRARHEALEGLMESEGWRQQKDLALSMMQDADFWNAPERFEILGQAEYQDRTEAGIGRAGSLLRRLDGRGNAAREHYPRDLVRVLGHNLYLLELACEDIRLNRPNAAFLLLESGRDSSADRTATVEFAAELGRMYRGWAKRRRMHLEILEEKHDEAKPAYRLLLAVSGFGSHSILADETGIHVLEVPVKKSRSFTRCKVHIRVVPQGFPPPVQGGPGLREQAESALQGNGADKRKVVRWYRREPSPLVRDGARGWRTGRLDQVLAGNFDLIEDH